MPNSNSTHQLTGTSQTLRKLTMSTIMNTCTQPIPSNSSDDEPIADKIQKYKSKKGKFTPKLGINVKDSAPQQTMSQSSLQASFRKVSVQLERLEMDPYNLNKTANAVTDEIPKQG